MIRPRLSKVASGTRLTTDLVNSIINRTEYAADLLRQYKLIAGTKMYVEPHYDGTRVSYLQPVAAGATPLQPISSITVPFPFPGFLGQDKFNYVIFSDLDTCPSGPNPAPDGVATFVATETENFFKCVAVTGLNMSLNYNVGIVYSIPGLVAAFPVIISNTRRCINPNSGCGNPTGQLVRLDLSNSL
jgi:hypothetical protein